MSVGRLGVSDRGRVRVLELCRPDKRNALTRGLLEALRAAVEAASGDGGVGALVVTGAGGAFCAGWDVEEVRRLAPGEPAELSRAVQRTLTAIECAPVPVLAAVEGAARGGGCGIACAADLRIFASSASIGVPEVALGTIPGGGIVRRLEALAGAGVAAELLYTGEPVGAARAHALGLANRVVPDGSALQVAVETASAIAAHRPEAVRAAKRVLLASRRVTPGQLIEAAAAEIEALLGGSRERS